MVTDGTVSHGGEGALAVARRLVCSGRFVRGWAFPFTLIGSRG